jgi:hypothetical protein
LSGLEPGERELRRRTDERLQRTVPATAADAAGTARRISDFDAMRISTCLRTGRRPVTGHDLAISTAGADDAVQSIHAAINADHDADADADLHADADHDARFFRTVRVADVVAVATSRRRGFGTDMDPAGEWSMYVRMSVAVRRQRLHRPAEERLRIAYLFVQLSDVEPGRRKLRWS